MHIRGTQRSLAELSSHCTLAYTPELRKFERYLENEQGVLEENSKVLRAQL